MSCKGTVAMISETTQDIFECKAPSIVIHQVNCLGYGSLGLMQTVMKKWPELFQTYHSLCGWFKDYHKQNEMLGSIQALPIPDTKMILCNAFSQKFFSDSKYESIPSAWEKIIKKVIRQTKANFKATGVLYEFHAPAKIGVCMPPEEINALKEIVKHYFENSQIKWIYHI